MLNAKQLKTKQKKIQISFGNKKQATIFAPAFSKVLYKS